MVGRHCLAKLLLWLSVVLADTDGRAEPEVVAKCRRVAESCRLSVLKVRMPGSIDAPRDPGDCDHWAVHGKKHHKVLRPFVIFFGGQTGTTHLFQSYLNKHRETAMISESHSSLECITALARLGVRGAKSLKVFGTKVQRYSNLDLAPGTRVIHIRRRNLVAWGWSKCRKKLEFSRKGYYACLDFDNCTTAPPIHADVKALLKEVDSKHEKDLLRTAMLAEYANRTNSTILDLVYEDAFGATEPETLRRISRFVGITPPEPHNETAAFPNPSLCATFANWPEVFEKLRGTQYEKFLTDADAGPPCVRR